MIPDKSSVITHLLAPLSWVGRCTPPHWPSPQYYPTEFKSFQPVFYLVFAVYSTSSSAGRSLPQVPLFGNKSGGANSCHCLPSYVVLTCNTRQFLRQQSHPAPALFREGGGCVQSNKSCPHFEAPGAETTRQQSHRAARRVAAQACNHFCSTWLLSWFFFFSGGPFMAEERIQYRKENYYY